ncbi:hypothetical protein [Nostoc piscinale]|uniref:hypothetical protein n=1 Tax=Nostoc piscinale TaxID=224012 RepID=UPI00130DE94A|nr:hypothetical protein [Nostoc piscinale]
MLSKQFFPCTLAPFTLPPASSSGRSFSMKAIALAANNDNFKDWEPLKIEVYERSRR